MKLLILGMLTCLLAVGCTSQEGLSWMGVDEEVYVDCFFDNYRSELEQSRDYGGSIFTAELACNPPPKKTYKTYSEFLACKSEAADLYQSKYGDLEAEAVLAFEQEMRGPTDSVCWPLNDLRALPDAPTPQTINRPGEAQESGSNDEN